VGTGAGGGGELTPEDETRNWKIETRNSEEAWQKALRIQATVSRSPWKIEARNSKLENRNSQATFIML
jgi:hypothetical protein